MNDGGILQPESLQDIASKDFPNPPYLKMDWKRKKWLLQWKFRCDSDQSSASFGVSKQT